MQSIDERLTLADAVHYQNLTGEKIEPWELTALADMHDSYVRARKEGPPLEKLSTEIFDAMFLPKS